MAAKKAMQRLGNINSINPGRDLRKKSNPWTVIEATELMCIWRDVCMYVYMITCTHFTDKKR